MVKGERIDPTSELRCAALLEAVVAVKGPVVVVGQTPQKPTIALSHLSYVEPQKRPELCPPNFLGPYVMGSQSKFRWD